MTALISSLIVLGILGIVDSSFLLFKHIKKKPLFCPLNSKCNIVTESRWSKILFVRNEFLGLIYYLSVVFGCILLLNDFKVKDLLLVFSVLALLFSMFLVYLQMHVIKNYCFYCLLSSLINLLIFLNLLII
jgi:uncharacterized membrane protein